MIGILLFIAWLVITFFIFKATKEHNEDARYDIYKATWEPYFFSALIFFVLVLVSLAL